MDRDRLVRDIFDIFNCEGRCSFKGRLLIENHDIVYSETGKARVTRQITTKRQGQITRCMWERYVDWDV
jgi:hypothetical protein